MNPFFLYSCLLSYVCVYWTDPNQDKVTIDLWFSLRINKITGGYDLTSFHCFDWFASRRPSNYPKSTHSSSSSSCLMECNFPKLLNTQVDAVSAVFMYILEENWNFATSILPLVDGSKESRNQWSSLSLSQGSASSIGVTGLNRVIWKDRKRILNHSRPFVNCQMENKTLTVVPPLGLFRVLIARFHVECVVHRPLLLPATAQHGRDTKTHCGHW